MVSASLEIPRLLWKPKVLYPVNWSQTRETQFPGIQTLLSQREDWFSLPVRKHCSTKEKTSSVARYIQTAQSQTRVVQFSGT